MPSVGSPAVVVRADSESFEGHGYLINGQQKC